MNKKLIQAVVIGAAYLAGYLSKPIADDAAETAPVDTHPAIWRPAPVTLAMEVSPPDDKTCDTINLNGREWGLPFYVIAREGVQCHRVIGAPRDPTKPPQCTAIAGVQP